MSMSREQENFGALRRLLALKRYEQPPPRYFNDFSQQVVARIRAGDMGDEAGVERWFWEVPWLQRLWVAFETKPLLAGCFGAAVCALLVGGVIYSETLPPAVQGVPMLNVTEHAPAPVATEMVSQTGFGASDQMAQISSTNGVIPDELQISLFDQFKRPSLQRVSFEKIGN